MLPFSPLRRLEGALERAVRESGRAQSLCAQLDGRRLRVVPTGSPWRADLHVASGSVHVELNSSGAAAALPPAADAELQGSVAALLGSLGERRQSLLQTGALRLDGDAEIGQRFSDLLHCLRPDLEHELARLTGPVPAHVFAEGVRGVWRQAQALLQSQSRNAADYLAHERAVLVSAPEAEHRYRQIEATRERLDRLEARLRQQELRP